MNVVLVVTEVMVLLTISFLIGGIKVSAFRYETTKKIVSKSFAILSAIVIAYLMWKYYYDGMLRTFLGLLSEDDSGAWADLLTLLAIVVISFCYYFIAVKMTTVGSVAIAEWRIVWQNKRNDNRYICRSCGSRVVDGREILCIAATDIVQIIAMDQERRRQARPTMLLWKFWSRKSQKKHAA